MNKVDDHELLNPEIIEEQAEKEPDPDINEDFKESKAKKNSLLDEIEAQGASSFYSLRSIWSFCIIVWITILIVFNMLLTVEIGEGKYNFKDYQWFITTVTAETFLQIVGLGYVAAHYLFSNKNKNNKK